MDVYTSMSSSMAAYDVQTIHFVIYLSFVI